MGTVALPELAPLLAEKRQAFAARNPESKRLHDEARRFLPGGHTRTILAQELAAVLVEPMLGSGGCIPATLSARLP